MGRDAPPTGRFPMMQWVTSHLGTWAALTGPNFFFFLKKGQSWVRKHVEEMREKLGVVDKYHIFKSKLNSLETMRFEVHMNFNCSCCLTRPSTLDITAMQSSRAAEWEKGPTCHPPILSP